ncbi:MAG TPA: SDR family oxidoreductase [Chitinophagaceae bacterium]|jgi:NAD(P)-dependent dehydrogenase (short-subunit alcohol dehydrogenase family)
MSILTGKNIVVVGGTGGIGYSATKAFVAAGAHVVVAGRDEQKSRNLVQELGKNVRSVTGDAGEPGVAEEAVALCTREFGPLHGLYHVAGGSGRRYGDGPLHELTLDGWNATIQWNLTSLMLSNQAAVRAFLKTAGGGTILNMGSVLGFSPSPGFFSTHAYAASKSAVIGFSKTIAAYYAKDNIRVNVVAPAVVETPMAQRAATDKAILDFLKTKQPLDHGRIGQPSDVDGIALYFMSDQSKFTTGQIIAVDGGWSVAEGQYK